MKKLLIPTFAISALLLATGCDLNKRITQTRNGLDQNTNLSLPTEKPVDQSLDNQIDEVKTAASSTTNYGVSEGSAAAGNAKFQKTAQPVIIEADVALFIDDSDYDLFERQAMEEVDYKFYPPEKYEGQEERLNRLEKENAIFYGNPSATGASGSPGSYELSK
jgi:hypothetical protein